MPKRLVRAPLSTVATAYLSRSIACAVFILICALPPAAAAGESSYKLGIQDKLRIYAHEWPALTGEFTVGAGGSVSLPLIGAVPAAGLETQDLAKAISERLQANSELRSRPSITVEVAQYRPFYIMGGVERPGEYAYRPGMTVLTAVSIAGGAFRSRDSSSWVFERDAIQSAADARVFALRRSELVARMARLKAEAANLDKITFPPPDEETKDDAGAVFQAHEQSLFEARRDKHQTQLSMIRRTVNLHEREIESLRAQISAEQKQSASVQKELDDLRVMISRGLAPAPRILPLERTIAQIEREQRELETSIIRARQQINQAEQMAATLSDDRRGSAMSELKTSETQLKEAEHRHAQARRILLGATSSFPEMRRLGGAEVIPTLVYSIVRSQGEKTSELAAEEATRVEPGDIVRVRLQYDNEIDPSAKRSQLSPDRGLAPVEASSMQRDRAAGPSANAK
jgi:exopolysaccharide production protein ExoF